MKKNGLVGGICWAFIFLTVVLWEVHRINLHRKAVAQKVLQQVCIRDSLEFSLRVDTLLLLVGQKRYGDVNNYALHFERNPSPHCIGKEYFARTQALVDSVLGICARDREIFDLEQAHWLYAQGEYHEALHKLYEKEFRNPYHTDAFIEEREAFRAQASLTLYQKRVAQLETPEDFSHFSYGDVVEEDYLVRYFSQDDEALLVTSGFKAKLLRKFRNTDFARAFVRSVMDNPQTHGHSVYAFIHNEDYSILELCLKYLTTPEDVRRFERCFDRETLNKVGFYQLPLRH